MSDTWLRAEPLWFGVHLAPEHGFLPETKKAAKQVAERAEVRAANATDDKTSNGENGRKRRRSVSADRRRKALQRGKKGSSDDRSSEGRSSEGRSSEGSE